jgi:hypothetical protein
VNDPKVSNGYAARANAYRPECDSRIGLFAVELIRTDTVIWRFTPGFDLDVDPALIAGGRPSGTSSGLAYRVASR